MTWPSPSPFLTTRTLRVGPSTQMTNTPVLMGPNLTWMQLQVQVTLAKELQEDLLVLEVLVLVLVQVQVQVQQVWQRLRR